MNINKSILLGAMVGAMCASSEVRAADAPEPLLKVQFDTLLRATLILQNAGALTICYPKKHSEKLESRVELMGDSKQRSSRPLEMSKDFSFSETRVGTEWQCSDTSASTEPVSVRVREAALPSGVFRFPETILAPLFESPGWLSSAPLTDAFGSPVECGYFPAGSKPANDPKKILDGKDQKRSCSLTLDGARFRAQLRPKDSVVDGQLAVRYEDGSKVSRVVLFDIAACSYQYAGRLPALVQGARKQRVVIAASQPACISSLTQDPSNKRISLVADGVTLQATVNSSPPNQKYWSTDVEVDIEGIPASAKVGIYEWKLVSGGDELGSVRAEVVPAVKVEESLSVNYKDAAADALQSRASAARIAVTDPTRADEGNVTNTATIVFPESLSAYTGSTLPHREKMYEHRPQASGGTATQGNESNDRPLRFWTLKQGDVQKWTLSSAKALPFDKSTVGMNGEFYVEDVSHVSFHVKDDAKDPLLAVLRLYETKATQETISKPELLLEVGAKLATSARTESLPLPIASALRVYCFSKSFKELSCSEPDEWPKNDDFDTAGRGEQKAIDMQAVENGYCWLALDTTQLVNNYEVYGPQSLRVTVHREGVQDKSDLWHLNLAAQGAGAKRAEHLPDCSNASFDKESAARKPERKIAYELFTSGNKRHWFHLQASKAENNADAVYVVGVEVAAESKQYAIYRSGVDSNALANERKVRPDQSFETRLRSRGRFGPRIPWRFFFTVPVVSGFRFPSSPVDLKSTSDAEYIEGIPPRVGVLVTAEPWDYDKSQHPWAFPLRGQLGLQMYQGAQGRPAFSFVAGVSAALPVFETTSPQLQSSANIGAFYEMDLREIGGDFNVGNQSHFLLTFGFNVFSLLGAK